MRRKRRNFKPSFKAKVAVEALKGDKTLAELAEKYELHPNQINDWRKQLMDGAAHAFSDGNDKKKDHEAHVKELHAKIGQLALENDFLAKALDR